MAKHRLPDPMHTGIRPDARRVDEFVRLAEALRPPRPAELKPDRAGRRALRKARRAAEARGA